MCALQLALINKAEIIHNSKKAQNLSIHLTDLHHSRPSNSVFPCLVVEEAVSAAPQGQEKFGGSHMMFPIDWRIFEDPPKPGYLYDISYILAIQWCSIGYHFDLTLYRQLRRS